MDKLLHALWEIMIALGLYTGIDRDLLITMIFAWTICENSSTTEKGKNEINRIIQRICALTGREETVRRLLLEYGGSELFQTSVLEECFQFLFPYVSEHILGKLRLIDRLFLLYYSYSCSWDELTGKNRIWMEKHGVSEEQYIHLNKIEIAPSFHKQRINGHLKECLEILDKFHKDHSVLLGQLRAAKCYKWNRTDNKTLDLSIASDIPAGRQKENNNMLQGPRPENRIYEEVCKHLLEEAPVSEIINKLYYFDKCDDATYETEFLLKELQKDATDNVLVVNPSPDMIRKINEEHHDYKIAVFDDVVRDLYKTDFGNIEIKTFNELLQEKENDNGKYSAVLLIVNKPVFSHETGILNVLSCCMDGAFILVSVSEGVLNKAVSYAKQNNMNNTTVENTLMSIILKSGVHPYRILQIPDEITQSTPKSKRLLYCRKTDSPYSVIHVLCSDYQINSCEKNYYTTKYTGALTIRPERALLTETELFVQTGQVKIKKAYDSFLERNQKEKERYNKLTYEFSAEIRLLYTIGNTERPNRVSFYYKPKSLKVQTPSKNRQTHRETDRNDLGSAEEYIEDTVINDLNEIIAKDLSRIDLNILSTYTFKTQWLLVRPKLLKKPDYDDVVCRTHIFRHGSGMNSLRLKEIAPHELKAVMEIEAGKTESLYIWKQIQLIVSELINASILSEPNIVESIIKELKKIDRSGVKEVKQALDCPGLSLDQQRFIREYIYEKCDPDRNKGAQYYFEIDSRRIFVAAKFLNGAIPGEWLTQTWGNVNSGLFECYSISIGQYVREKGLIIDYAKYNPELNRKNPLNPEFAEILLVRRKFLEKHYPVAAVDSAPIFLESEPTRRNQAKLIRMEWSTAIKAIKEIIDKMYLFFPPRRRVLPDGPESYEVIKPYKGDVLKRSFEYSCVDYTRMRGGLLAYLFGRKPDLTHDMFYVDYGCEAKLAQSAAGFNRWTALLVPETVEPADTKYKLDGGKEHVFRYEFRDYMRNQLDIKVQSKEKHAGKIKVRVKSKHAADVMVAILKPKEDGIDE